MRIQIVEPGWGISSDEKTVHRIYKFPLKEKKLGIDASKLFVLIFEQFDFDATSIDTTKYFYRIL